MGIFTKRVPDEALFGATAMVFALCIDTIFNGGETSAEERAMQISSLRKVLGDLSSSHPGCAQAIAMLDSHYPVGLMGLTPGGRSISHSPLTREQINQAEALATVARDGLSSGASGPQGLAVGELMLAEARKDAPTGELTARGDHCALIIGLAIDKVNFDTAGVHADERVKRRKYAAAIAGFWLYRQVCC